jgi:predicted NAD/FAD-dependent oxidoreductase
MARNCRLVMEVQVTRVYRQVRHRVWLIDASTNQMTNSDQLIIAYPLIIQGGTWALGPVQHKTI